MSANPPRHIVAHVPGSHSVVSTTSCQQLLTKAHPFPPGLAFWCNIAMSLAVRWSISEVTSNEWDEAIDDVFDAREVIIHLSVCDAFPAPVTQRAALRVWQHPTRAAWRIRVGVDRIA